MISNDFDKISSSPKRADDLPSKRPQKRPPLKCKSRCKIQQSQRHANFCSTRELRTLASACEHTTTSRKHVLTPRPLEQPELFATAFGKRGPCWEECVTVCHASNRVKFEMRVTIVSCSLFFFYYYFCLGGGASNNSTPMRDRTGATASPRRAAN